jgi:hypothetical protein
VTLRGIRQLSDRAFIEHSMSNSRTLYALAAAVVALLLPAAVRAQLIQIKTLPLAQGDQFGFFPSANEAMGGVSIAVRDSLLDPFVNPAKGSRVRALHLFGAPTFYSISRNSGGGQTLPVGGLASRGDLFGGAVVAFQQLDPSHRDAPLFTPPTIDFVGVPQAASFPIPQQTRAQTNRYAFATLGRRVGNGFSFAGSVLYADLHRLDGVDQLYAGSQSIAQHGGDLDARFGVVRDWESGSSVEALFVHDRLAMTHDVTFAETFYDPNLRRIESRPRPERNLDRTNTWGLQLGWQRPVGDSGWRVGAFATSNLMSHPKLPNYQIVDVVRPVPWDPGHSAAYNIGMGVARHRGPSTFALDVVYEPILSHTWGEAPADIETLAGSTILAGGKTSESHFTFSNAIARLGIAQDLVIDGVESPLHLQGGISAHAVRYWLRQDDHVLATSRRQEEHWTEWAPTWGASMRVAGVDVRYLGRVVHGTGRPGIINGPFFDALASSAGGPSILATPTGPLTLTPVSVTTHQLSISVPLP